MEWLRESQERRPPDSSLKTLLIASLIIFLDALGRLDSSLPQLLNLHPIEASRSRGSRWAFFSRPHRLLNSSVLSLLISIPARLRESGCRRLADVYGC